MRAHGRGVQAEQDLHEQPAQPRRRIAPALHRRKERLCVRRGERLPAEAVLQPFRDGKALAQRLGRRRAQEVEEDGGEGREGGQGLRQGAKLQVRGLGRERLARAGLIPGRERPAHGRS